MVHWVSCIWYVLTDPNIFGFNTLWIPVFDLPSGSTALYQSALSYQYLVNFYYGVICFVGRANEMAPVSFSQTCYCALIIILGSFASGFIFGNISTLMESGSMQESRLQ